MLQKSNSVILVASNTNYQVTHGRPRHVNLFVKRVSKRSQIDNLILHTFKGFNLTTLGSFFSSTICFRTLWTKLPCILVYIFVVYQQALSCLFLNLGPWRHFHVTQVLTIPYVCGTLLCWFAFPFAKLMTGKWL